MKPRDDFTSSRTMTVAELAEYLRVHRATVCRMARKGQIPSFNLGSDWRFDRDAIENWMTNRQATLRKN
jgi:excisionase family DNA binding protein